MAYKIKQIKQIISAEIRTIEIDLYGAFEGPYILEERLYTDGQLESESFHRKPDGTKGDRVENLDTHLQLLYNYNQWQKETRNENTIQN